jgi:hypothetical protein
MARHADRMVRDYVERCYLPRRGAIGNDCVGGGQTRTDGCVPSIVLAPIPATVPGIGETHSLETRKDQMTLRIQGDVRLSLLDSSISFDPQGEPSGQRRVGRFVYRPPRLLAIRRAKVTSHWEAPRRLGR